MGLTRELHRNYEELKNASLKRDALYIISSIIMVCVLHAYEPRSLALP